MRKSVLIAAALACSWPAAVSAEPSAPAPAASPADEAARFVMGILDKFNAGDAKAWVSAQADDTMIVDEFAPHAWSGKGSPQRWLDDYMKDSGAKGISGGRVDYGKPLQATSDGTMAYIVLPATYSFVQKGTKMAGPGSMTFVTKRDGQSWKIVSWTYSAGGNPAPQK